MREWLDCLVRFEVANAKRAQLCQNGAGGATASSGRPLPGVEDGLHVAQAELNRRANGQDGAGCDAPHYPSFRRLAIRIAPDRAMECRERWKGQALVRANVPTGHGGLDDDGAAYRRELDKISGSSLSGLCTASPPLYLKSASVPSHTVSAVRQNHKVPWRALTCWPTK